MKFTTPSTIAVGLCAILSCLSGCTTTGLNMNFLAEKHQQESTSNLVEQIIPVWRESEGPGLNPQSVTRGFGGQVYFITQNRGLPSEVHGKVRIYVFDDQGADGDPSKPIHQFDYDAETWQAHMSMSKLGPSLFCVHPVYAGGSEHG